MRSFLVIDVQKRERPSSASPESVLEAYGYQVFLARDKASAGQKLQDVDAAILHLPVASIQMWGVELTEKKEMPLFWWCSADAALSSTEDCEVDVSIDGILAPGMKEHELNWALHFGGKRFFERKQWKSERDQLKARLEERKWIDMAKGILGEVNGIPEAEAYELLRKKAMNERKRIVDVAVSIVKAHQMLKA
ncbi:ANTAR domain-containing response regulator [Paenibacillus medicaginis]|uniref:ANTAR domain-containing response regulator n=1 Tax=Paenibacillus medicaginis TaxID=1470560 RepID=A0ABV5C4S4_9BACL